MIEFIGIFRSGLEWHPVMDTAFQMECVTKRWKEERAADKEIKSNAYIQRGRQPDLIKVMCLMRWCELLYGRANWAPFFAHSPLLSILVRFIKFIFIIFHIFIRFRGFSVCVCARSYSVAVICCCHRLVCRMHMEHSFNKFYSYRLFFFVCEKRSLPSCSSST